MSSILARPLHEDLAPGDEELPDGESATESKKGAARVSDMERLFYALGMTPAEYLRKIMLPLAAAGIALALFLPLVLEPVAGKLFASVGGPAIGAFFILAGALVPFLARESRRNAVNQQMHVFITHLGVLTTTPISRVDMFGILASKKTYGPISEECQKIYSLVKHWRLSLPEACRFVGQRTPSELLADFLDRLAHALEAGDKLEDYLMSEQVVVMHQYASLYGRKLKDMEGFRELFSSMMMGAVFLAVFALLMPVITGVDSSALMPLVLLSMVGMLGVLLGLAKSKAPHDPLWHRLDLHNDAERWSTWVLAPAAALAIVAASMAASLHLPLGMIAASAATPLALSGLLLAREEANIRRRDDNYPAFIRSLGAGVSAKSGAPQDAVESLSRHDFGPLTPPLKRLQRRLAITLNNTLAWKLFAVETGSHLTATFNAMFLEATRDGGNPMKIANIISTNTTQILALRKQRAQVTAGLRGTLLGMAGALAFTMYLNVGILSLLTGLFTNVNAAADILPGVGKSSQDPGVSIAFATFFSVAYAAAASLSIRFVAGGRMRGAFFDLAIMLWVSGIVASVVGVLVQHIL